MGSIASLFQQGGFFQQNAGSIQSLVSAAGSLTSGIMERQQAAQNARMLERQGVQAEAQGRREAKKLEGAQRARYAKAGVAPGEGTALDVILESREQATLEARRRRMAFQGEADTQRKAGSVALLQGIFGAGSTLLGAVGRERNPSPLVRDLPAPSKYDPQAELLKAGAYF
jgi:hypothetical protein